MNRFFVLRLMCLALSALLGGTAMGNHATAQVAVKTNLLYDAATTPNLGIEVGMAHRSTVQLVYGLNPWKFRSQTHGTRMVRHWVVMPEYRWWTCTRFNGHFVGLHAMGGQFNAASADIPVPGVFFGGANLRKQVRHSSLEGGFAGLGATYGYQWILSRHFNLEAEAGLGYCHAWFNQYACGECGPRLSDGNTHYLGITKLGFSVIYLF